jgi:hypothetical protein
MAKFKYTGLDPNENFSNGLGIAITFKNRFYETNDEGVIAFIRNAEQVIEIKEVIPPPATKGGKNEKT